MSIKFSEKADESGSELYNQSVQLRSAVSSPVRNIKLNTKATFLLKKSYSVLVGDESEKFMETG